MKERMVGAWRLVSYETDEQEGKRGKPYGDAVGRLVYDDNGNMSGQVMRPGRALPPQIGLGLACTRVSLT